MRITKGKLRQIIREELQRLNEVSPAIQKIEDSLEDNHDFLQRLILDPVMSKLEEFGKFSIEAEEYNRGYRDGLTGKPPAADADKEADRKVMLSKNSYYEQGYIDGKKHSSELEDKSRIEDYFDDLRSSNKTGPLPVNWNDTALRSSLIISDYDTMKRPDGGTDFIFRVDLNGVCKQEDAQKLLSGMGLNAVADYSDAKMCTNASGWGAQHITFSNATGAHRKSYSAPEGFYSSIPIIVSAEDIADAFGLKLSRV